MAPSKKVLMLCGDYMEDYEAAVPLYALTALGVAVDCVAPGKRPGDACLTAVHDFLGFELYTELPGHGRFAVTADFAAAAAAGPSRYDALVVPGGRFVEALSADGAAVALVAAFAAARRPVVLTCHSQLLLAAAGAMGGVRCTAFFSLKPVVELAGGTWVDPHPFEICVADGHVLTAVGWPAHAEIIRELLPRLGARVDGGSGKAVLILCADYVDDYEANVPFRALAGVGCRVEAACPTKRKGEPCVTAIYDAPPAPGAVGEERRGHNFVVTADWADVSADGYDCVVVPGGRAPELLVTHEKAVALVREFAEKGKAVASIGQGHLLLAAAGLLGGKRCASGVTMRVVSRLAGAEVVEDEGAVADGNLVTAAGWPDLAQFVARVVEILGVTVSF